MAEAPSLARGTRDFGPQVMQKRQYILSTIRQVFETFGFAPLETPAMENLSVLTGKYGEEGDQLIFKILNSGDFAKDLQAEDLSAGPKALTKKISEKALRYDLTVPFARFVVMNRGKLTFPFKRYQIQPVWRADRPQKGRYREFYQCDADVVGTDSLLCEAEILLMIHQVLHKLGLIDFTVKLNNRKILSALSALIGAPGREGELCVAIDKLDKIGQDGVLNELEQRGFSAETRQALLPFLHFEGDNRQQLAHLGQLFAQLPEGQKGVEELLTILDYTEAFGQDSSKIAFDLTLARGLSYYTGAILEVKVNKVSIGSISGGGRYDNLTGTFGVPGLSGVGFSFGVDRLYDVLEELNLFPASALLSSQVLVAHFDDVTPQQVFPVLANLRQAGVRAELYPEPGKLKKQFQYAEGKGIPYLLLAGPSECESGVFGLKNLATGQQANLSLTEVISQVLEG